MNEVKPINDGEFMIGGHDGVVIDPTSFQRFRIRRTGWLNVNAARALAVKLNEWADAVDKARYE